MRTGAGNASNIHPPSSNTCQSIAEVQPSRPSRVHPAIKLLDTDDEADFNEEQVPMDFTVVVISLPCFRAVVPRHSSSGRTIYSATKIGLPELSLVVGPLSHCVRFFRLPSSFPIGCTPELWSWSENSSELNGMLGMVWVLIPYQTLEIPAHTINQVTTIKK